MSEQAYKSFQEAVRSAVERFRAMETDDQLAAAIALIDDSGIEYNEQETMFSILGRLSEQGSIDAVSLLISLGASRKEVVDALKAASHRSEDVVEGMVFEGLMVVVEEWAEEEVAAGRMVKTICPKTGHNLYQTVEKKT